MHSLVVYMLRTPFIVVVHVASNIVYVGLVLKWADALALRLTEDIGSTGL